MDKPSFLKMDFEGSNEVRLGQKEILKPHF